MCPLAARDGLLKCREAVAGDPSVQSIPGVLLCCGTPVRRTEVLGNLVIDRIGRQWFVEVHPVAVDVDIVLVRTPEPRKAVRVDGVYMKSGDIVAERHAFASSQPLDRARRAEKSFDPVRARDSDQYGPRAARAAPRGVGRKIEIARSLMLEGVGLHLGG